MKIKGLCLAIALLTALPIAGALAQDVYPTRTVTIVVGYPGGTPVDTIARVIATKLADRLGKPVIVENKPGAGSSIGAAYVAKSAPDGYTLYLSSIANTTNPAFNKLSFDFAEDLGTDLAGMRRAGAAGGAVLGAPIRCRSGYAGASKARQLFLRLVRRRHRYPPVRRAVRSRNGNQPRAYPYKGSWQAVVDLLAGRIQIMFSPAGTVLSHLKTGELRALAVSGNHRVAGLPDVPTFDEAGVKHLDFSLWFSPPHDGRVTEGRH